MQTFRVDNRKVLLIMPKPNIDFRWKYYVLSIPYYEPEKQNTPAGRVVDLGFEPKSLKEAAS